MPTRIVRLCLAAAVATMSIGCADPALEVLSVEETSKPVAGANPFDGTVHLIVRVRLDDVDDESPPGEYVYFDLTAGDEIYEARGITGALPEGCTDIALPRGEARECDLVFDVPPDVEPATVVWTYSGTREEADVP